MWESVGTGLIRLCLLIDSFIYGIVSKLFSLFVELANYSSMFFSKSVISSFTGRIYILVGVIALFIIVYSLLMSIANPDEAIKGKNSGPKIIMNLVTSIVLIALVPSIFNFAYAAQEAILGDDIIGRIFLGTTTHDVNINEGFIYNESAGEAYKIESNNTPTNLVKQHGNNLAWSVLNAFFYPEDVNGDGTPDDIETKWSNSWGKYRNTSSGIRTVTCWTGIAAVAVNVVSIPFSGGSTTAGLPYTTGIAAAACGVAIANEGVASIGYELTDETLYWGEMKQRIIADGEFSLMSAFAEKIEADEITYMPIVSTIVGLILLYLIFSFCIDLGLRAVKLAFYQMIAPIPIFMRILPNNKVFGNWTKAVITTFVEVFTRMVILYTIVFLASNISNTNLPGGFFAKMIIIMGIVTFGKQAPKLLAEVTGIDSGNMKLGIMDKMNAATFGFAGGVLGGATGFLGAGIAAKAAGAGFFSGGLAGAANGWKARGNQFGKQKQSMYKSLGGKGKAGLLGRRSWVDQNVVSKMKDAPKNAVNKNVDKFESSSQYQNTLRNLYAQHYGLSVDDYNEANNLGLANINSELDSYDYESAEREYQNQTQFLDAMRKNTDYDQLAGKMFTHSDYYDSSKSLAENKVNREKFIRDHQKEIDDFYIRNGGQHASGFANAITKQKEQKEIIDRVNKLKAEKEYLNSSNNMSAKEKEELSATLNERARTIYKTSNSSDSSVQKYKKDLELQEKIGEQKAKASANDELAKYLKDFMKDNNINKDDKKK